MGVLGPCYHIGGAFMMGRGLLEEGDFIKLLKMQQGMGRDPSMLLGVGSWLQKGI